MHVIDDVILGGWAAFWVYWLASSVGVKASQSRSSRFSGARVGLMLVTVLLLRTGALAGRAKTTDPWMDGAGLVIFVLGLALAVWARLYLGRNWGMPMSRKVDPELVTTGPYRHVRHPIYSGMLLAMIGTAIAVNIYTLVAVVVLGAYFLYSAHTEERFMASQFPDTYPLYRQSTKMLVPFVF